MTINPRAISYRLGASLLNNGCKRETKKADVLSTTNATEILEYLMLAKKQIQCAPVSKPTPVNLIISLLLARIDSPENTDIKPIVTTAIATRHQTNRNGSSVISLPRMPVNPHINTMRCNNNKLVVYFPFIFRVQFYNTTTHRIFQDIYRIALYSRDVSNGHNHHVT